MMKTETFVLVFIAVAWQGPGFTWGAASRVAYSKLAQEFRLSKKQMLVNQLSVDPKLDYRTFANYDLLPNATTCGKAQAYESKNGSSTKGDLREKRIIGGKVAKLGRHPWFGRLEILDGGSGNISEICGATLINSRYALTAAHCVTKTPSGYSVSSMSFATVDVRRDKQCMSDNSSMCTQRRRVDIEEIIIHDDYVSGNLYNDIALIKFTQPVTYDEFVSPICLPWNDSLLENWPNSDITAVGFGRATGDDNKRVSHYPNQLREVELPIADNKECEAYYKRKTGKIDKTRFCAGGEPERDACRGDSGGPLLKKLKISELDNQYRVVQFGVVSFGHCALEGIPGGYINVMYYMPWIMENLETD